MKATYEDIPKINAAKVRIPEVQEPSIVPHIEE